MKNKPETTTSSSGGVQGQHPKINAFQQILSGVHKMHRGGGRPKGHFRHDQTNKKHQKNWKKR